MLVRAYHAYQEHDEQDVIGLWNETLNDGAPHNDPKTVISNKLSVNCDLFIVAEVDGRIIGTAMGGYDGHRGWLYSVAVLPQHRRKGIGSALVRKLEAMLAEKGCSKINLQVRASNVEVIGFYRELGYIVEERVSMGKRCYS
jgi:ribosomal protein S18 acetylase RimI-like enzyme